MKEVCAGQRPGWFMATCMFLRMATRTNSPKNLRMDSVSVDLTVLCEIEGFSGRSHLGGDGGAASKLVPCQRLVGG